MTNGHQERAERVVGVFRSVLDADVRSRITDAQYEDLRLAVQEALDEERQDVASKIEQLLHELRASAGKPEREI